MPPERTRAIVIAVAIGGAVLAVTIVAAASSSDAVEVGPVIMPAKPSGVEVLATPSGVAAGDSSATIIVKVLVDSNGRVRSAEATGSSETAMREAALRQAKRRPFRPAVRDGKRAPALWTFVYHFRPQSELDAEVPGPGCIPDPLAAAFREDELSDAVELPRLVKHVSPTYPTGWIHDKVTTQVKLECIIDTCGSVRDCRVVEGTRAAFEKAAIDAVTQWRYDPGRRDGKPVAIRYQVDVSFWIQ